MQHNPEVFVFVKAQAEKFIEFIRPFMGEASDIEDPIKDLADQFGSSLQITDLDSNDAVIIAFCERLYEKFNKLEGLLENRKLYLFGQILAKSSKKETNSTMTEILLEIKVAGDDAMMTFMQFIDGFYSAQKMIQRNEFLTQDS